MHMNTIISMGCLMDWAHADKFHDNALLNQDSRLAIHRKNTQNPSTFVNVCTHFLFRHHFLTSPRLVRFKH